MAGSADDFCLVYVTTKDEAEAEAVAHRVVTLRLAACANILGPIRSIYHWDGRIQDERECAVIFKTRRVLFARLEAEVRAVHSYDCPCVVALPLTDGSATFLAWIMAQTATPL